MKSISLESVIASAAALALVYALAILLGLALEVILCLYIASTAAMLWMVFRILKDPVGTDKTFDDYFYQDRDDIRRVGKD